MTEILLLGKQVLLFLFFPFLGFVIHLSIKNLKLLKFAKYLILILLFPYLLNYHFTFNYVAFTLTLLLCALFFADSLSKIKEERKKEKRTLWLTFGLLLFLSIWAMIGIFGKTKKEKIYTNAEYNVYRHAEYGFAGPPLVEYELCRDALIPIYEKSIDRISNVDSCLIHFKYDIDFDRCNKQLNLK